MTATTSPRHSALDSPRPIPSAEARSDAALALWLLTIPIAGSLSVLVTYLVGSIGR